MLGVGPTRKQELSLSHNGGAFQEGEECGSRARHPEGGYCRSGVPVEGVPLALTCPPSCPEPRTGRSLGTQSLTHQGPMWPPLRSATMYP